MIKDFFDLDLFYVYLSNSVVDIPIVKDAFERYYESQKFRFYEMARTNRYYNNTYIQDRSLASEVAMKRVFGILLCSKDDENIQSFVSSEFEKYDSTYRGQVKNFNIHSFEKYIEKKILLSQGKKMTAAANDATIYFIAYLLISEYGLQSQNDSVDEFLERLVKMMHRKGQYNTDKYIERLSNTKIFDFVRIERSTRKFIEGLKEGSDLCFLLDIYELSARGKIGLTANNEQLFKLFREQMGDNSENAIRAVKYSAILADVLSLNEASYTKFLWNMQIDKNEQELLKKIIANTYPTPLDESSKDFLRVDDYIVALLFNQLVKIIKSSREFYFKNNSETQFLEINRIELENEQLRSEISEMQNTTANLKGFSERLQSQVEYLSAELSKDTKDAVKPLENEIYILKSRIRELEEKIIIEKEKEQELFRLREFAFSVQTEYLIEDVAESLYDLIDGKSLIIIGGHINWRNKMKNTYPMITLLDGHNASIDNQVLLKADIVLLNTSNMSHSLYYKVIDFLRRNSICFDYIGKSSNQELLEREIVEIITKRL